ncbi:uncharacterized protein LOC120267212 [Dioscorea cayenensis subsp. rotundata]|uniref:Uncharacterized protein LOC120267212 n=1 Tax=Dioscorea cayennensis subsp. rotundata TaxID=55577 RepID=A0AB40BUQ2_DIOCR|nr:uncharacterized protein LOC120267212 [Dioscorea cayenensis subsp. rotundata]
MFQWPGIFRESRQQDASFQELAYLLRESSLSDDSEVLQANIWIQRRHHDVGDIKRWSLTGNGIFSVKSFYNFLNDGGLRCDVSGFFLENSCPSKINIFNWLACKNKILTLENLEFRRCNKLPTATCVMCHSAIESVDHLFIHCSFAREVWMYFVNILNLPKPPSSFSLIWVLWRGTVRPSSRIYVDLVVKALAWNIWLARNDRIFNNKIASARCLIMNIDRMLLSWFDALADNVKGKIDETMSTVKRSLEFLGQRG